MIRVLLIGTKAQARHWVSRNTTGYVYDDANVGIAHIPREAWFYYCMPANWALVAGLRFDMMIELDGPSPFSEHFRAFLRRPT